MGKNLIILSGDPFYRKEVRKDILSSVLSKRSEVLLSSPSCDDLIRECLSNSLFNLFKVIRIESFVYKKEMEDFFKMFLSTPRPLYLVMIEEPDLEKAAILEKKLLDIGLADKFEIRSIGEMKPKKKVEFVRNHALELGVTIDSETSEIMLDLCGGNLSIVHEELTKLNLLFGAEVSKKQVLSCVTQMDESKDAVKFYLSLMSANSVQSVQVARQISAVDGHDVVLGCLVKISYLVLLLHCVNGNDVALMNFLKKKRSPLDLKWVSSDEVFVSKSEPPPSQFMIRVAKKLYDRVGSRSFWSRLFTQCYENYVEYRVTANDSKASADIEKVICIVSGR